jgi:hypothetical protein
MKMTVVELRALAAQKGITGISGLPKDKLVAKIRRGMAKSPKKRSKKSKSPKKRSKKSKSPKRRSKSSKRRKSKSPKRRSKRSACFGTKQRGASGRCAEPGSNAFKSVAELRVEAKQMGIVGMSDKPKAVIIRALKYRDGHASCSAGKSRVDGRCVDPDSLSSQLVPALRLKAEAMGIKTSGKNKAQLISSIKRKMRCSDAANPVWDASTKSCRSPKRRSKKASSASAKASMAGRRRNCRKGEDWDSRKQRCRSRGSDGKLRSMADVGYDSDLGDYGADMFA